MSGQILVGGRNVVGMEDEELRRLRGRDIAMIFQDPMTSLNPSLKVRTQLAEVLVRHQNMEKRQAQARAVEMLERVGIPEPQKRANAFPHELSGGMRQRVMIAMALLCRPKILIADEPTTALDVTVQAQMLDLFKNLTEDFGTALVLITHDLGVVAGIADRMMVMYGGRAVETGGTDQLFYDPRHPYTYGLLNSTPHVERKTHRLNPIEGLPPSLEHLPKGCAFHPRCAFRFADCLERRPPLVAEDDGRERACFYHGALRAAEHVA
jgi:oligopeptide transport system ATP-binding protein